MEVLCGCVGMTTTVPPPPHTHTQIYIYIYQYLLMSEVVQSEELGRGLFAVICRLLFSSG